ncbi:hypothetical protein [Pseudoduganella violaceinigra]|uniref:hypothetical protein n=1 Tax=Pseudoduganella violaceinigra TaxID=246602 RepID=UPI0003F7032F|nr:hypothetical protein [Pseudoduganella violaceinigra]
MNSLRPPTIADIHVPLIIWMNPAYRQRKISHSSMFATMLDVGGVAWEGREPQRSVASPQFREGRREVQVDLMEKADYETLR